MAVIDATFAVVKRNAEKIQACTGFEPLTSAIPVQYFIDWGNKPTGSRSLNWFVLNRRKDDDEVKNIWTSYTRTMKEERRSYRRNFCTCRKKAGNVFPALAHSHWSLQHHMTSNNETVSCQNLWAGNIAKSKTSKGNSALLPGLDKSAVW